MGEFTGVMMCILIDLFLTIGRHVIPSKALVLVFVGIIGSVFIRVLTPLIQPEHDVDCDHTDILDDFFSFPPS